MVSISPFCTKSDGVGDTRISYKQNKDVYSVVTKLEYHFSPSLYDVLDAFSFTIFILQFFPFILHLYWFGIGNICMYPWELQPFYSQSESDINIIWFERK